MANLKNIAYLSLRKISNKNKYPMFTVIHKIDFLLTAHGLSEFKCPYYSWPMFQLSIS